MSLKEEIKKWADETTQIYNNIATSSEREVPAFYTQSDLSIIKERPKVLIMGINPGSDGSYKEQREKPLWGLDGKLMDGTHLLQGNPCWKEHCQWTYWQRLRNLFEDNDNPLDKEDGYVATNATFFATSGVKDLNDKLLIDTLPCTLKLIDILKPEMIVVLSAKSLLKMIKGQCYATNRQFSYSQTFASYNSIFTGRLNDIPFCGIPHVSASLFREERELMQKVVTQVYHKKNINIEDYKSLLEAIKLRRKAKSLSKEEMAMLYDSLVTAMQNLPYPIYESTPKFNRYDLKNGLQLTIANNDTTHGIAIRPIKYHGEKNIDQLPISYAKDILRCLEKANYVNSASWLGVKDYKALTAESSIDNIADKLVKEIANLISEIYKILPPQQ